MRMADGVLLVVDAAEGALVVTEKVVKQALAEGLPITLLLTKARRPPRQGFSTGCWPTQTQTIVSATNE
jgi:predicted membrane GTPase involved in stress response